MMFAPDPDEDEVCPRCGGDHTWCQSVQSDEYGPIDIEQVVQSI